MATADLERDTLANLGHQPLIVHLQPVVNLTEDQFFEFCRINRDLRIERNARGELMLMPPAGWETGNRDLEIGMQLKAWAKRDGTGIASGSSAGFRLPNNAVRSPDAAWVKKSRLAKLTKEEREKFLPLCPNFVLELRSPSDSLSALHDKMQEYIANGAQLGWLIDPVQKRVYIYRPDASVEQLERPETVCGDPALPGFVLDLHDVWISALEL